MDQRLEDFDIWDVVDFDKIAVDLSEEEPAVPSSSESEPTNQMDDVTAAVSNLPAESTDLTRQSQYSDHYSDMFNHSAFDDFLANVDPSEPAPCAENASTTLNAQIMTTVDSEIGRILDLHPGLEAVSYPTFDSSDPSMQIENEGDIRHAIQAIDSTGDPTPRVFKSDLALDMALSEVASTRPEQLSFLDSADRAPVAETEMAAMSSTNMVLDGTNSSVLSILTPHQCSLDSNSCKVSATVPAPEGQLQPASKRSLLGRKYAPLRPKQPPMSQNSDLPSTRRMGDASNHSLSSSEMTLASRPPGSTEKPKRKRSQSPGLRGTAIPGALCFVFRGVNDQQQQMPTPKRQKIKKACLRCQLQKAKVSCRLFIKVIGCSDMEIVLR